MANTVNTILLDLGTTAIKAAVCTDSQQFEPIFSQAAPKITVNNGEYVSDAMAYLATVDQLLEKCQGFCQTKSQIGLCYQRSSFLLWRQYDGLPVTPLVSWQDNRGQASCEELQADQSFIKQQTGLPLTPYYFAPKVRVLLQQQPELLRGLVNRTLLIGTLDSFLIWRWTAGQHYLTDASMAARTQLMDIHTGHWSESLSELFNIPHQVLAEICPSNDLNLQLDNGSVLQASVADQSAAFLASVSEDDSEVLVNLGTGGFVIRNNSEHSSDLKTNYLSTLIYQNSQRINTLAIEGTLNSIAAALKPYPIENCNVENLAELNDIFCIAEPSGIGAPFFRTDIAVEFSKPITGLTKHQIAGLLLEGIIFRVALILEEFNQHAKLSKVYLSGGLSTLPCLQQGLAVCSPVPVFKLIQKHSGLQGVAILTNNLPAAFYRQSDAIFVNNKSHALIDKYQHWKVWLNQLLAI